MSSWHIILPAGFIGAKGPVSAGDIPGIPFIQARDYRIGRRGYSILWLVMHSAECAETKTAAEALQSYALKPVYPSSWNYACDVDSITQSVREKDTAFHVKSINDASIGIECAGRAAQLASDWADPYSEAMLWTQVVPLAAGICQRHLLPVRQIDDETLYGGWQTAKELCARKADSEEWLGLRTQVGGIVTHAQVSRAFKVKGGHSDPGIHFPLTEFVERVRTSPVMT